MARPAVGRPIAHHPGAATCVADVAAIVEAGDDADRWTAYVTSLGTLIVELGVLRDRIDPDLDPATARVVELVGADANRLADLVAATPPA